MNSKNEKSLTYLIFSPKLIFVENILQKSIVNMKLFNFRQSKLHKEEKQPNYGINQPTRELKNQISLILRFSRNFVDQDFLGNYLENIPKRNKLCIDAHSSPIDY